MYAVFRSAEKKYIGTGAFDDVLQYFVNQLRKELCVAVSSTSDALVSAPLKLCEFILAGFEDDDVATPAVESHIVFSGTLNINGTPNPSGHFKKWSNRTQATRYGGCWIGNTAFISHVVNHTNKDLPPISGQYELLTLADAVAYTQFLVAFTCDFQRFAIMVPNCGRPIASATLTPEEFPKELIP